MKKVVFTLSDNYVDHLCVAIFSLFYNNPQINFTISVFTDKFSKKNEEKVRRLIQRHRAIFELITLESSVFDDCVLNYHFAAVNYFRLQIPQYYLDDIVLYLDVDIVVNGDISELFNINIEKYYLAAVSELNFNRFEILGMKNTSSYFNAGVMLINNKKWKKDDFGSKVLDYIKMNPNSILMADQDGLNSQIDGDFFQLPIKYNAQAEYFKSNKFAKKSECIIVHYSGSVKPWHLINRAPKHPLWYLYWYYFVLYKLNLFKDKFLQK